MGAAVVFNALVGRTLRALRERSERGQEDLAAALGLPQSSLSRIERGKTPATAELLHRITAELGATAADLLSLVDAISGRAAEAGVTMATSAMPVPDVLVSIGTIDRWVSEALHESTADSMDGPARERDESHVAGVETPPYLRAAEGRNPFLAIRNVLGITQQQAADQVGVSRALWSAWETDSRPITLGQLRGVHEAFGLSSSDMETIVNHVALGKEKDLVVGHVRLLHQLYPRAVPDPASFVQRALEEPDGT